MYVVVTLQGLDNYFEPAFNGYYRTIQGYHPSAHRGKKRL